MNCKNVGKQIVLINIFEQVTHITFGHVRTEKKSTQKWVRLDSEVLMYLCQLACRMESGGNMQDLHISMVAKFAPIHP